MGAFAVLVAPREEEPQIDVTFANIVIPFPGASSEQVENLVATPMKKVLIEIADVKDIYSVSRPGLAVLTVQYKVGIHRNERLPDAGGTPIPDWNRLRPKAIDDVPIVTLTLNTAWRFAAARRYSFRSANGQRAAVRTIDDYHCRPSQGHSSNSW